MSFEREFNHERATQKLARECAALKAADKRATEHLRGYLNSHQHRTYGNWNWFYVRGSDKGLYVIYHPMEIVQLFLDQPLMTAISYRGIHLRHGLIEPSVPVADSLLAQMLLLSSDASIMHRMACRDHMDVIPTTALDPRFIKQFLDYRQPTAEGLAKNEEARQRYIRSLSYNRAAIQLKDQIAQHNQTPQHQLANRLIAEWTQQIQISVTPVNPNP